MKQSEVNAKFRDIMIGTAARDPQLGDAIEQLIFSQDESGVFTKACAVARVAGKYALDPDAMQEVIYEYERWRWEGNE